MSRMSDERLELLLDGVRLAQEEAVRHGLSCPEEAANFMLDFVSVLEEASQALKAERESHAEVSQAYFDRERRMQDLEAQLAKVREENETIRQTASEVERNAAVVLGQAVNNRKRLVEGLEEEAGAWFHGSQASAKLGDDGGAFLQGKFAERLKALIKAAREGE